MRPNTPSQLEARVLGLDPARELRRTLQYLSFVDSHLTDHTDEIDQLIADSTPEALQERYGFAVGENGRVIFKDE